MPNTTRIEREARTIATMVDLYCSEFHSRESESCIDCQAVKEYALNRLAHCPYQNGKTTCVKCPTHCYQPEMRSEIRKIMRTAGPRMIWKYPLLTVQHMLDGIIRSKPIRLKRAERSKSNNQ